MSLRNWHQRFRQWFYVGKKAKRSRPSRSVERLEIRSLMSVSPSGVTINATETASFTGTVATFTSNDPLPQSANNYSATIKWGDGATTAGTVAATAGGYNVNGQHTYADDGNYSMTVIIDDNIDHSHPHSIALSQANVAEQPLSLTPSSLETTEGTSFTGSLATFSDPGTSGDPRQYSVKINWGDGQTSGGTLVYTSGPNFDVRGIHTYGDEGTYSAQVTVSETGHHAPSVTTDSTVTVVDGDLFSSINTPVNTTEGQSFSGVVTAFVPLGTPADPHDFAATISWGDGATSAGQISVTALGFWNIVGSHTYADEGRYRLKITLAENDPNAESYTATNVAHVADGDVLVPVAAGVKSIEGSTYSGTVATFSNAGYPSNSPSDFTATIIWGDGNTSAGTVGGSAGTLTVSGSNVYAEEGAYSLTVVLSDDFPGTATATATGTANVADADLLAPVTAAVSATEGSTFSGTVATFTNTGYAGNTASDFTATIVWGDGNTSTGTVSGSAGTLTVSGSNVYAEEGAYSLTVVLSDDSPGVANATATGTANVADADVLAPVTAGVSATEGTTFSGAVATFSNAGYPSNLPSDFSATIIWGDGNTSTGTVSGSAGTLTVSGSNVYADEGTYSLTVVLSDDLPGTATATATGIANVADADLLAPVTAGVTATEGTTFSGAVATFSNTGYADNTASDFSATIIWGDGNTSTGTVTGSAGTLTVSGSNVYAEEGAYSLTVVLSDDLPGTAMATATGTANVADADVLAPVTAAVTATEGSTFAGTVATFSNAGYPSNSPNDFTATIIWGDGNTSTGTVNGSAGTLTVSGSNVYADEGAYSLTVVLSDDSPRVANATATGTANVADADVLAPVTAGVSPTEGSTFSGTVATFTNTGYAGNTASDFSATIIWGDGNTSTGTVSGSAGTLTVSGSNVYADEGSYSLTVVLSDDSPGAATATATGTANVADADVLAPVTAAVSATEGTTFSGTVATFSNTGYASNTASGFTATIIWGDGNTSSGTVSGSAGTLTVSGSNVYADEGAYSLTVVLSDDAPGTAVATATGTANVADADMLAPVTAAVSATEGMTFSGTVATFSNAGYPNNSPSDFTATIIWGDGNTSSGTVSGSAGTLTVSGSNVYAEEGAYSLTVVLSDDSPGTATATATGTANVADADMLMPVTAGVSATEGSAFSGTVATFTNTGYSNNPASDFSATIIWGDGNTSTGTVSGSAGTLTVSGSNVYADEGAYKLTVLLSDDAPGIATATASGTANVADADAFAGTGTSLTPVENMPATAVVATFSDTKASADPGDFSALIDWGDGNTSIGTVSGGNGADLTVTGNHTYAEDGAHTITTTLSDTDGTASANSTSTAAVQEGTFILSSGPTLTATEGQVVTAFPVATFQDPGSPDDATAYAATIDWGDGVTDAGTVTGTGGNFTVTGSHTYLDEFTGSYSVTVSEPGADFTLGPISSFVSVADGDSLAPVSAAVSTTEGQTFSGAVATFTNAGYAGNAASDFTATIIWGDGDTSTGTISGSAGTLTVNGSHAYADEGDYSLTVTLSDDSPGTASATATGTASVAEGDFGNLSSVTISPTETQAFSGVVGTFSDVGNPLQTAADFTANIDWGDGTMTAGTITGPTGGPFSISGQHTYADDGTYTVLASFSDDPASILTSIPITSTAVVSDADSLAAVAASVAVTEGTTFSGTVATFTNAGYAGNAASDFTATIIWGDGNTSTGTVSGSAGTLTVSGSNVYAEEGTYSLTVVLSDDSPGTAAATATGTANVANADVLAPVTAGVTATEGTTFSGAVATFTNAGYAGNPVSDFTATIIWGDGNTSTGTVSGSAGTLTVSGSNVYAEEGAYSLTVVLSDDSPGTASATATGTANVADADSFAISATAISTTQGSPFSGQVATFTDSATSTPAAGLTATINWGDGTTSAGTITSTGGGHFTVSGAHTYNSSATQLTVTVTDAGGATQTANAAVTVASLAALGSSPIVATAATINGNEWSALSNVTVATFTHTGSDPASNFTATINWGDGTTTAGTVALSGGTYSVTGSHSYSDEGTFTTSITIDDVPDSVSAAVGGSAVMQEELLPGGVTGTANERFVSEVYREFIGRAVDSASLAFWAGLLDGGQSRVTVAGEIIAAADAGELRDQIVENAFETYLHRAADPGALSYFGNILASGGSPEEVDQIVLSSDEYYNVRGGGTMSGFLSAAFEDLLGRAIDASALATYEQMMALGDTRMQVVQSIMASPEYDRVVIDSDFTTYLHRTADASAVSGFTAQFAVGYSQNQVLAEILGSNEFFSQVS